MIKPTIPYEIVMGCCSLRLLFKITLATASPTIIPTKSNQRSRSSKARPGTYIWWISSLNPYNMVRITVIKITRDGFRILVFEKTARKTRKTRTEYSLACAMRPMRSSAEMEPAAGADFQLCGKITNGSELAEMEKIRVIQKRTGNQ